MSLQKMEEDYSERANKAIAENRYLAKQPGSGKLDVAVENLLNLEKHARLASDVESTVKLVSEVVKLCGEAGAWKALNDNVLLISKKRAQLKQAVTALVKEAMEFVDKAPDRQTKYDLINTLRLVSEGKIHVEVERARLTRQLAKMKEEEGEIGKAADILQEVQIETIGSMHKREKMEFILEAMRLTLEKKDYIRTHLISQKITSKVLNDEEVQDLKIKYHELMIRYYTSKDDYLNTMRSYQAIYNTPTVQKDPNQWTFALECVVLYLILSPYDHEQADYMHRIYSEKKLEELPLYRNTLKMFIDNELISWPTFEQQQPGQQGTIRANPIFSNDGELSVKRWTALKDRVIEHNVRVVAKYYSRIQLTRLAQLLTLDEQTAENFVSKMVTSKTSGSIVAKIDRIDGVITFAPSKESVEVLNDWSANVSQLLGLVENTVHLINKENMVHRLA